jgi:hypothetical protein
LSRACHLRGPNCDFRLNKPWKSTMQELTNLPSVGHPAALAALALIYTTAAVFSGLSGFGFSAIGCLSLALLPPQTGIAMLMSLSLVTQAWSFRSLRGELRRHSGSWTRRDGAPYLICGTAGMPVGLGILAHHAAAALPVTLLGNSVGVAIYRKAGDVGYRCITFAALGVSGFGLVAKVLIA